MSLYFGTSDRFKADLIAGNAALRVLVEALVAKYMKPMVGEVKFTSKTSRAIPGLQMAAGNYYTANEAFDGWVWADGVSKYSASDFPTANSIFNTTGASSFTILKLTDFICGASEGGKRIEEARVDLPLHDHQAFEGGTIGTGNEISIPNGFAYVASSKAGANDIVSRTVEGIQNVSLPVVHYGIASSNKACVPLPIDISLKISDYLNFFNNVNVSYAGEENPKFIPEAQQLQAMIYIGKKGE